jgi:hypothetical protein
MADVEKRTPMSAEHARLEDSSPDTPGSWKAIGPYLSERAWATAREDYGADGQVWQYFPYEQARSNGRDPFLKERIFGLSGPEGNHGEDAKEYWWYVDATPTSSWLR